MITNSISTTRKSNQVGSIPFNDDIYSISLFRSKHYFLHWNIGPFFLLYILWFVIWTVYFGLGEYPELGMIITVIIAILQIITCLFCYWFVQIRAWMQCVPEKSPWKAELVVVKPTENNGYSELVPLHHGKNPHDQREQAWFIFQKCRYIYDESEKKTFKTIDYPLSNSFHVYLQSKGYQTQDEIDQGTWNFGLNKMVIDIPKFIDLFIERATAPFFVFQVFCVLLWCLDEYWYYSLLTLFMLVVFEITLVQQQKRNMAMIRQMGNQPYKINVYRQRKWIKIDTTDILPGDLCSVLRSNDNNPLPCDMLLLRGQCIVDESMLTGESIPQMKEPIENVDENTIFDLERHGKLHVLSAGTRIVQHTPPAKMQGGMKTSDNGCVAYALRTGFSTSQGKLLKTILYSVKRVTANNLETFLFILFLLVFAIIAASYVWIEGTKDPKRNRYKLFIECTLILTSVVPPELPIELSLAVNTSLIALVKLLIYCTEPFRIPFAGKVDICCFDKTGTLTSDDLVVEGVAGVQDSDDPVPLAKIDVQSPVKQVLLTCHALANLDNEIIGDPLEKATLNALEWTVTRGDTVVPVKGRAGRWQIYQRYHFLSALKRMSVIAGQSPSPSSNETTYIVTVKGAPETLKPMFSQIPDRYDEIYLRLSRQGARVLALGHRNLGILSNQQLREQYPTRNSVECNLDFCGFVVLSCPLKPDSKAMIRELRHSSHHLTMITGDNPLTACHVAKELNFTRKPLLVLTAPSDENESDHWKWESVNKDIHLPIQPKNIRDLTREYDLCITGEGLAHLGTLPASFLNTIMPHVKVFARVSPKQKEQVVIKLNNLGFVTLMCGDGTNDVAALKHAHVGVALLTGVAAKRAEQQQENTSTASSVVQPPPVTTVPAPLPVLTPAESAARAREQAKKRFEELYKQMDENEQTIVRLGDASIAAPFTSRTSTIQCVCHIIKQGRCTLVTTLQMFKILALNALILAYSLSVLYLDGIKFSDGQHTLQGLLLAGCFLFISRSKPLKTLARERPLPNIFNFYTLISVLSQFAVHLSALIYVVNEAHKRIPPKTEEFADLEAEFSPNLVNSTVYIMSVTLQIATFAVNYQGYPFMESLRANKPLLYSIVFAFSLVLSLIFNLLPQLTEQFQIVIIPDDMRLIVFYVVLGDVILAYIIDRVLAYFLGQAKLKQY